MAQGSGGALKHRSTGVADVAIRLLGPVDVVVDGRPLAPPGRYARTMLAVLAVRAGQVVPADVLIEAMWGPDAPRTARHALHVHASALRRLVPGGPSPAQPDRRQPEPGQPGPAQPGLPLVGRPGGYVLQVAPGQLDIDRFEDLAGRGRAELASGAAEVARALLGEALALWRGPALADVPWERFADGEVRRWDELRHAAEEDRVDAGLATGRHAEVVGDLEHLVRDQPFRERRWGQLMVALYRSGRQAEALDRYRQVRTLLGEELGIPPSAALQDLEAMILRQDEALEIGTTRESGGEGEREGEVPETRYARGPAGRLAYQVLGEGPGDLVFLPGFGGNVELRWEEPRLSRLYRRLARSSRLVLLDRRGTGLSDRDTGIPPVEEQVDDVLAVMDAAGVERAALLGVMDGGALALLVAARHPQRVGAVATYACFAAYELLGAEADPVFAHLRDQIDRGLLLDEALPILAPDRAGDAVFSQWLARYLRMAAGVGGAVAVLDRFRQLDVRAELADVGVPVLALHREHDRFIPASNAAYIADHVAGARAVILPGADSVIWAGDVDAVATEVEAFLGETGSGSPRSPGRSGRPGQPPLP
jgi:pimeloyl-ACP methyl ester carboxylesterase/DNA-binding SARP family transcriptional activator